jgi:serine/threonine protein phosphatase PrpC
MSYSIGYYASIGGKAAQEDRLVCIEDMRAIPGLLEGPSIEKKISYFAVFDGHGGSKCSTYLAAEFHVELGRHPKLGVQPITALRETGKKFDDTYYKHCLSQVRGDVREIACDGSTASVAVVVGDDLYMLNCGDSAAGLISTSGGIEILTEDHGTENISEATRVVANGGVLRNQTAPHRKHFPCCCFITPARKAKQRLYPGGLLVTRAFGDFNAKIAELGGLPGVVVADHGEIKYKKLDNSIKSIILASDGLWDGLTKDKIEAILLGKDETCTSTRDTAFKVDIDRHLDESVFSGFDTELDDSSATQAYAIGRAAVWSPAWRKLGLWCCLIEVNE